MLLGVLWHDLQVARAFDAALDFYDVWMYDCNGMLCSATVCAGWKAHVHEARLLHYNLVCYMHVRSLFDASCLVLAPGLVQYYLRRES